LEPQSRQLVEEQAFMSRNCGQRPWATPPQLEKDEAATIKATSITVPANHLAMLSHPREVAELIEQAAAKAK